MQTAQAPSARDAAIHLKKILVPVDFSDPSEEAVRYAMRFAKEFGADIILLYVVEKTVPRGRADVAQLDYSTEEAEAAGKELRSLARLIAPGASQKVPVHMRRGDAAHEIVQAAKELDTDLIIIATHGYTGWKHFCIGSTAESVARTAPCPVLVVREKEHDFL
jgi:universal stress protein A